MNSLVPLTCAESYDVQSAVLSCMTRLEASISWFDIVAEKILREYKGRDVVDQVQRFLDGSRYLCLGNLSWRSVVSSWQDAPITFPLLPCHWQQELTVFAPRDMDLERHQREWRHGIFVVAETRRFDRRPFLMRYAYNCENYATAIICSDLLRSVLFYLGSIPLFATIYTCTLAVSID